MLSRVRRHLSYANVMASVAVFLALGGVGYAAATLPRNSVGTRQLKSNAVTSAKVKNRSLLAKDFKKGQVPKGHVGARGPQGLTGPKGDKGDTGPAGTPDLSTFYTKTESDARFAPLSAVGNQLDVPGTAFTSLGSGTTFATTGFFGIFETAGLGYLTTNLEALPRGARITSVDFFLKHNAPGTVTVYLSEANAATGGEGSIKSASTTTQSTTIQTLNITPSGGFAPAAGVMPLLFWLPPGLGVTDTLYGARVHYTLG